MFCGKILAKITPYPSPMFYIKGGVAKNGSGNIILHNSAGHAYIENSKQFYSSCENCITEYEYQRIKYAYMTNVTAYNVETLAGYNSNYRNSVRLTNVEFSGKHVCRIFEGRNDGKESRALGDKCQSNSIRECVCK